MSAPAGRRPWFERTTVILAFLSLFPGFFFYNFLLGTGRIPPFLAGYFAPVSVLFVLPLVVAYTTQLKRDRDRLSGSELHFGIFMIYFAALIAVNAASGANLLIVVGHMLGILFMVNALIMFKMIDFADRQFRYPAMACLLGMSAIVFIFPVDGSFRLDALGVAKNTDSLSTYQGMARSYLVTFLPIIAYTRSLPLRILLYAAGAATLFLNTARSEFVALLSAIPVIEFYFTKQKLLFILVLAALATLVSMNADQLLAQLPNNRILELLDLSQSTSATARHHMKIHALQTISNYPILGDYASYAPGHYAHNVLSAWVDLGAFGFTYLLGLLIFPVVLMLVTGYFSKRGCGDFVLAFALACVTLLLLMTSHFFSDMLIGATVGSFSKYYYRKKHAADRAAPVLPPSPPPSTHIWQAAPPPHRARP